MLDIKTEYKNLFMNKIKTILYKKNPLMNLIKKYSNFLL